MSANNMQTCDMHAPNLPFRFVLIAVHSKTANRLCTHHPMAKRVVRFRRPWSECATWAITSLWHIVGIIFDLHAVRESIRGSGIYWRSSHKYGLARTCPKSDFIHVIFHLYVLFCSTFTLTQIFHCNPYQFCIYGGIGRNGTQDKKKLKIHV